MNPTIRQLVFAAGALLLVSPSANAQQPHQHEVVVQTLHWAELQAAEQLRSGEVSQHPDEPPHERLTLRNETGEPQTFTLVELDPPRVTAPAYVLRGTLRYTGVEPAGYLELWSHFPDGSAYFTRTLDSRGPLQQLAGDSPWRSVELPFYIGPVEAGEPLHKPQKLVLNLVLPGEGTVVLGPFVLVQLTAAPRLGAAFGGWDTRAGNLLGAVLGTLVGLSGAAVGILSGLRRARRFVLTLTATWIVLGALFAIVGIVAWWLGQPYAFYYPLLLVGIICVAVNGPLLPRLRTTYREHELRRMQALDV